jgi:hypothetical protein
MGAFIDQARVYDIPRYELIGIERFFFFTGFERNESGGINDVVIWECQYVA